jgi:DNA-directed RNA polymerase specialized sigma24 family protein
MVEPVVSRYDVEEFFRRHAGELPGYLYRRAGQAGADLLGEVFVVALQRLGGLPQPDLRCGWLFSTARRLLLAAERNSGKRHHAENERARFLAPTAGNLHVDRSDRSGRDRAVHDALGSRRDRTAN